MYPCTKFQLIWRTSDFATKFAPPPKKNMNGKSFEKINILGVQYHRALLGIKTLNLS